MMKSKMSKKVMVVIASIIVISLIVVAGKMLFWGYIALSMQVNGEITSDGIDTAVFLVTMAFTILGIQLHKMMEKVRVYVRGNEATEEVKILDGETA